MTYLSPRNKLRQRRLRVESLERRELLAGDGVLGPQPLEANESASLKLMVRDSYLPGIPVLVRAQLETSDGQIDRMAWDETVILTSPTPGVSIDAEPLQIVNGMGSTLVTFDAASDLVLNATWGDIDVEKSLTLLETPTQTLSGTLESDTTLSGVVRVTDDLLVPSGLRLDIEPGTLVLLDGVPSSPDTFGTQIVVEGTMTADGTADDPITFTATDPTRPWSEIDVKGGTVQLNNAVITRAGSSPRGGHTNTGPALRLRDNGSLNLQQSSVADISGKIMQSSGGTTTILDSLLTRAVMGPEINDTALDLQNSWIVRMNGQYHHDGKIDDNDGIYLHSQRDNQEIRLSGAVVADVQDDGIDTLGSDVVIENTVVRNATDKAVSVFHGEVRIEHALLVNCGIGVETKGTGTSTPHTIIDRTTIANISEVGVFAKDKGSPDPDVVITYDITNTIIHVQPGADAIKTDYDPDDLHVNYSLTPEAWNHAGSGMGNVDSSPMFVDLAANDFRLAEGSPAIDAGDPNGDPDADGTRADMGYLAVDQPTALRGDFNQDNQVNADDVDRLCTAIQGRSEDGQFDLNGDSTVDDQDMQHMIGDILGTSAGDANLDGVFDSADLVAIFQAGQYEDEVDDNSGWAQGDWDCDGDFTTSDLLVAFQIGKYVR